MFKINPQKEVKKIVLFIRKTLQEQKISNTVIGISGGVDSATSLFLLRKSLPPQNIFVAHLSYFPSPTSHLKQILDKEQIPPQNRYFISIQKPVDIFAHLVSLDYQLGNDRDRVGNIMARVRMIVLYDLAKKHKALVCGTENKSEHLLGYFTRFGDAASDIEPIRHLYKTQVYLLATHLKVPEEIIKAKPTAGLWPGQTDEGQFGFSYEEADQVLHLYFDQKKSPKEIKRLGFRKAERIINFAKKNSFKHIAPYTINIF